MTLASVAPGKLAAADALARIDAARRLDRIAHHAWRSAAHLHRSWHMTRRKKLSYLTKFSIAPPANRAIVSDMAKHDPELSLLFHALADPTRRSILTRLAQTPARVTDLAGPTGLRLPTVMRHLSVLEEAGLITTSKDGRIRTCAIVPEALEPVRTWLDEHRAIWEARLDRLDAFVMNVMKEGEE